MRFYEFICAKDCNVPIRDLLPTHSKRSLRRLGKRRSLKNGVELQFNATHPSTYRIGS